jgi:hypothetical protein
LLACLFVCLFVCLIRRSHDQPEHHDSPRDTGTTASVRVTIGSPQSAAAYVRMPCHIGTGTRPTAATSAPGLGSPPATSAPGLGSPPATSAPGLGPQLPAPGLSTSAPGLMGLYRLPSRVASCNASMDADADALQPSRGAYRAWRAL